MHHTQNVLMMRMKVLRTTFNDLLIVLVLGIIALTEIVLPSAVQVKSILKKQR